MPADKDLLKRIAALNGRPLDNVPEPKAEVEALRKKVREQKPAAKAEAAALAYRRDVPRAAPAKTYAPPSGPVVRLEEAVHGEEANRPPHGKALVLTKEADGLWPRATDISARFVAGFEPADSRVNVLLEAVCEEPVRAEEIVFIDLETTGLSNVPVFLVGVMTCDAGVLTVRQYLARDYSEEAAITCLAAEELARKKLLVSFNGKTFDLPFLKTRAAACGVPFRHQPRHLDLLHEARKHYRRRLPDCKLQTLERFICGRVRSNDIPGSEVPEAYHAFVRTGNASQLVQILKHNALDLVTLAELLVCLPPSRGRRGGEVE